MDNHISFEVGKTYYCCGLYGFGTSICIQGINGDNVAYVYTDDQYAIHQGKIIQLTHGIYDTHYNKVGEYTADAILSWEYRSPYAKDDSDIDRAYYNANSYDGYNVNESIYDVLEIDREKCQLF